jgi:hypothetical protein
LEPGSRKALGSRTAWLPPDMKSFASAVSVIGVALGWSASGHRGLPLRRLWDGQSSSLTTKRTKDHQGYTKRDRRAWRDNQRRGGSALRDSLVILGALGGEGMPPPCGVGWFSSAPPWKPNRRCRRGRRRSGMNSGGAGGIPAARRTTERRLPIGEGRR